MTRRRTLATLPATWPVLMLLVVGTIGCDRVTKHVAATALAGAPDLSFLQDTVRLAYVENTGGFLSLGASWPPAVRTALFTAATGLMLAGLAAMTFRSRTHPWRLLGLTLLVTGGLSNWIDRLVRGSVVDFMNVGVGWVRTGIFNVADVAIVVGVAVVLLAELRHRELS